MDGFQYIRSIDKYAIHRDIKLENILLYIEKDSKITVKIADFGMALSGDRRMNKINNKDKFTICGSPMYMAPEVLKIHGEEYYDDRIDIWSLGVVFYKLASGRYSHPLGKFRTICEGITSMCLKDAQKNINKRIRSQVKCDKNLADLLKSMLSITPCDRISWAELFENVQNIKNRLSLACVASCIALPEDIIESVPDELKKEMEMEMEKDNEKEKKKKKKKDKNLKNNFKVYQIIEKDRCEFSWKRVDIVASSSSFSFFLPYSQK
jgi:serine/threonine protein kinase